MMQQDRPCEPEQHLDQVRLNRFVSFPDSAARDAALAEIVKRFPHLSSSPTQEHPSGAFAALVLEGVSLRELAVIEKLIEGRGQSFQTEYHEGAGGWIPLDC